MSEVKVTNSTTKKDTTKELDVKALLSVTRKKLGDFMTEDDVFLGKDDEPVTSELEASTKLEKIVSDPNTPSFKIAKREKNGEDGGVDDDPAPQDPRNLEPFKEGTPLTPIQIPEFEWAEDRVGLEDGLKNGKPVQGDKVSQMKVGQVRRLLKANRIDLNKEKYGVAAAFVDVADLQRAAYDAVQCTEVEVKPVEADRITNISFQYNERISRLHRTTTHEGTANVGMPGIFRVESSYRNARATRTDERVVAQHKSACTVIPKARVVFKDDKITLSDEFVGKIREAAAANDAAKLLNVFGRYGQFFASDMVLGGRLNYWTEKKLEDRYDASQDEDQFRLALQARGSIDGVPVEGGGGWGTGLTNEEKNAVIKQAGRLHLKIIGGNEAPITTDKWVPTVAKYLNWKVIGFNSRSLVPIIDYLDDNLRAECIKILKSYFMRNLQLKTTEIVGGTGGKQFGYDVGDVKRIVKIQLNHGINIDGLRVTYELTNGERKEMPWLGYLKGENNDTVELAFDEEISSIEVGCSDVIKRLAFNTTTGRRFPESAKSYYGRGEGKLQYHKIEAPRVCGLVGSAGAVIDSIGLRYRELAEQGVASRDFLLEMEPNLFPLNIPTQIEMTVKGILAAGKWRTEAELKGMSAAEKRNCLVIELNKHSNKSEAYFGGFDDEALAGKGAIVVFLKAAGIRTQSQLKAMPDNDHRNTVIQLIHNFTDEPVPKLQRLSDPELVRWGFAITGDTALATTARRAGA
jgi:hypothetical protein